MIDDIVLIASTDAGISESNDFRNSHVNPDDRNAHARRMKNGISHLFCLTFE